MAQENSDVMQSVDWVYATALLDLAEQAGQRDDIRSEMDQVAELLGTEPELSELLASRVLSTADRSGCIERVFAGRISDLSYRFLQVVNDKDRLADLSGIVRAFGKLVDKSRGLVEVDAYVASPMDEAQARRVADELGASLGGEVLLRQHVDRRLIGGLKLRVGDRLIDASVATHLRRMKEKIVAVGRDHVQSGLDATIQE